MAIFISYSHSDSEFVDRLAFHLIQANVNVWVDRWELAVGDSILKRVQHAIGQASALLVVLSKASVRSEWCGKEINSGLLRELEEKRVVVLPLLLEDCDEPLFLKGKLYADFRTDFDAGLQEVLRGVARVTNDARARIEEPDWTIDWAIDWWEDSDRYGMLLTMVEHAVDKPYTVVTTVAVRANEMAAKRYRQYRQRGLQRFYRGVILELLNEFGHKHNPRLLLSDPAPVTQKAKIVDSRTGHGIRVEMSCRLVGGDTGSDVLLDLAGQLTGILKHYQATTRQANEEELAAMQRILRTPISGK